MKRTLHYSEKARREGLLSLENFIDSDKVRNRDIFDYGLRFIVDGTEAELVDKTLSNIIKQEKDEQAVLLKTMQKEAVLGIQEGMNTRVLYYLLNSYTDMPVSDEEPEKIIKEAEF
jgi:flagellar motor component MotA